LNEVNDGCDCRHYLVLPVAPAPQPKTAPAQNFYRLPAAVRAACAVTVAISLVLAVGLTQPVVLASSTTLYVNNGSPSCSDTGSGTQTQPYCTIGKAAQLAQPGTTVAVIGGTYAGTAINPANSGLAGSPITFSASAGVTITGGSGAFAISGRSYIVISGFTISSTSNAGISVSSANNITISNNNVTGSGQRAKGYNAAGISLSGASSSLVTHNVSDNNSDHGFILSGGSANNTVSFNEASFNAESWQRNANGINVIDSGSTGNTLLGNVVHDNEDSGLQFFSGANNGLAAMNASYNNGDHGIDDYNVTGGRLIGNTVYHNCTDGINVEGTSGNYLVTNNMSVDNAVYPAYNGISCSRRTGDIGIYDSAPATTTVDYNLVDLTTSGALYVWANTTYASPAALYAATGQEGHGIQADPRWISWTLPNFRLQEGSPAIDSANSGASGESSADADGNPRVDDPSTPNTGVGPRTYDDRGAYEFQTIDTQQPSVPTALAATAAGPSQVNLTWNASTDNVGVAGYTVYRNGAQLATVTATGYTDGSVSPSTSYSYAVDAFDLANNHSAKSSPVSVTTPAPDTQPPSVPTGLTVTAVGATSVSLAWNPSTDNFGVAGYTVYRNGLSIANPTTISYTDTGLTPATRYSYAVDAFDLAANHSAQSAPVAATTSSQPISYVQGGTYSSGGRKTSMTITLKAPVHAADLLTGLFGQWDAAGTVQVSDNVNGSWTRARGITYSTGKGDLALYYLPNSKASSTGLAITIRSSAPTYLTGTAAEYSGVSATAPLDQVALRSGSGTLVDSGATGSVPAGELVFGALTANNGPGTITPGSSQGLTFVMRSAYGSSAEADIVTANAGAQDAIFSITNSVTWYAVAATFVPMVNNGDTVPPSAPTGLSAVNGTGSVSLSWNASTDNVGVTGYTVYRNGATIATVASPSFTDNTVVSATSYSYSVDAFDAAGNHSAQSSAVNDTTLDWVPPAAPGGVTATATGPTQVNLSWSASTDNVGVTGYTLYRNGSQLATVAATALSYSDATAAPSTSYSYTVDAFDAAGNHSAQSAPAAVTTPAAPDTIPPSTPTGLAASASAPTQVSLTWNASTDNVGVAGYTVYRHGALLTTVSGTTLSYTDSTVAASTTYSYTVDAFDAAGNHSAQSAPAVVTTPAQADTTPPSTPTGLVAQAPSSTQVTLAWNASTDNVGVTGYTVYRNGATIATVSGTALSYTDSTVTASTTYSYTVDAFDAAGNHSAQSAPASVTTLAQADTTPPSTPTGLAAQGATATQVNLTWNASTDDVGVTGYTLYRNGAALATVSGSTLAYTDTTVVPATNYSYTVDAFDAAGNHSSQSGPASVHVPGQPKFVQGKAVTTGSRVTSLTISFGPVASGDLLVGWFGQYDSTGQVSVSDNVDGAWTRSVSTTWGGTNGDVALYYFANSSAAPNGLTITVTAATATYLQGSPAEYSGVATVNPLDQVVIAKGSGTTADSGQTAATASGELVYGGMLATNGGGTLTPGTSQGVGFVKRAQSTSGSQGLEDITSSGAGQQHASFTFTNFVAWFMVCAVFKPA
jgi:chitodextrinase